MCLKNANIVGSVVKGLNAHFAPNNCSDQLTEWIKNDHIRAYGELRIHISNESVKSPYLDIILDELYHFQLNE